MPDPDTNLSQWARQRLAETGGDLTQLSGSEIQGLAAEFFRLQQELDPEGGRSLGQAPENQGWAPADEAAELDSLVRHPHLLVHRFLPDTTELAVGPALARFFGATPQALIGQQWLDKVPEKERQAVLIHLGSYTPDDRFGVYENANFDAEGRLHWVRWFNHAVFDEEGRLSHFQAVGMDLTDHKPQMERLRYERAAAQAVVDTLPDLFYMFDSQGSFLLWNQEFEEVSGYRSDEIPQMHPLDFISERDRVAVQEAIQRAFQEGDADVEAEFLTRSGGRLPYLFKARRMVWQGETVLNGFALDISERKRLEEEVKYQATHDFLTDLWNRRAFEKILKKEIQRAKRHGNPFSLFMMDIDRFKAVNDVYGHAVGDGVLQDLAETLKERLRDSDILARWGGEEFMAFLPETDFEGACKLAEDLRNAVDEADFPGLGQITVSLGVVHYRNREELKELTKRADDALYAAKEGGRNQVVAG